MKIILYLFFMFCSVFTYSQDLYQIELVKDIFPAKSSSYPGKMIELNDQLFFVAADSFGREMWTYDGLTDSVYLLKNINALDGQAASSIQYFTYFKDGLIFGANDGVHGFEPWFSDGTTDGTYLIKDLEPESYGSNYGSNCSDFTEYKGRAYFSGDVWLGTEPYFTDGTEVGTDILKNIGLGSSNPRDFTILDNKLYFSAQENVNTGNELWVTDGTEEGTHMVKDINSEYGGGAPSGLIKFKGKLYFSAVGDGVGRELWTSDGTVEGTKLVADINPSVDQGSWPSDFVVFNDRLYFFAFDTIDNNELWYVKNDSVFPVADLNPFGAGVSWPVKPHVFNNKLYFQGKDTISSVFELWVADTLQNTYKLFSQDSSVIENPAHFVNWNDKLIFVAGKYNKQIWVTDGTTKGTHPVIPDSLTLWSAASSSVPFLYKDELYFAADYVDSLGTELYRLSIMDPVASESKLKPDDDIWAVVSPTLFVDQLKIQLSLNGRNADLLIVNSTGRVCHFFKQFTESKIYDVGDLEKGVYFLVIRINEQLLTRKIVKQ